jgi:hypothetical protein
MLDTVVIELPVGGQPTAEATVESCELVLGEGRCRATTEAGPRATWHAVVRWSDEHKLHAQIEIHREHRHGPMLSERTVAFDAADSLEHRYSALGLLIVSHVISASVPKPAPPQPEPQPLPTTPPPRPSWGIDLAAVGGPGLRIAEPRFGGFVRGWAAPWASAFRPGVSLGWEARAGQPDVTWLTASLGAALRVAGKESGFAAELRSDAVAQWIELTAESRERGSETDRVIRGGLRLGAEAFLDVSDELALFAGVRTSWMAPGFTVEVEGRERGGEGVPTWSVFAGLRILP